MATGRWAIVVKETGEVSNIMIMEGVAPEINFDVKDGYEVVEVGSGVMIGMVRGGPQKAADGFGYPKDMDASNRNEGGVTRMASAKAIDPSALPATSHEKVRADEAGNVAKPQLQAAPSPTPQDKSRTPQDDVEQKKRDAVDAKAKQNRLAGKKRVGRR